MADRQGQNSRLSLALEAARNLWAQGFGDLAISGQMAALAAHTEIAHAAPGRRSSIFYRHLAPSYQELVDLLADIYRHFFKLALAHPRKTGSDPGKWAWDQLQPAVVAALEWVRDWHILACDGENRYLRHLTSTDFAPGQTISLSAPVTASPPEPPESWRAPAWLFQVSPFSITRLKEKHFPPRDSEEKLGAAHTRLLLKGARRMLLVALRSGVETVWNEETAAAGAIPAEPVSGEKRGPNKRTGWKQRLKLYDAIRKVLSAKSDLQGMEFCAELDKRHAPPLYDWMKRGEWRKDLTWKEAWSDPHLRDKIRRVRQEAMKIR